MVKIVTRDRKFLELCRKKIFQNISLSTVDLLF